MRTGISFVVRTLLLISIDLGWAFSGPITWGSGMCNLGYVHLSMVAKIKIIGNDGVTPDLKIPSVTTVECINGTSSNEYKLIVRWTSWDSDAVTLPDTVPTIESSSSPVTRLPPKETTQLHEETAIPKSTIKPADDQPATPNGRLSEKRDSQMGDESTSAEKFENVPSSDASQIQAKTGGSASTPADVISTMTTDVRSTTAVVSTSIDDNNELSTTINDVTTPFELDVPVSENSDCEISKSLQEDSIIAPFLCQFCDNEEHTSSSSTPYPQQNNNRLTLIITRRDDVFSVSDVYLKFLAPDSSEASAVFYHVFWKKINLFPGSIDATHVCENATSLTFNSQMELLLQNVKLAAFLPADKTDFPEKIADCSSNRWKDEANANSCREAEVILIVIAVFLGVFLSGIIIFYAAKLYYRCRRERATRDTLP